MSHDIRHNSGDARILNNTHQGLPTVLGYTAPTVDAWVWISLAPGIAHGGTADSLDRAVDEVLDTWLNRAGVAA